MTTQSSSQSLPMPPGKANHPSPKITPRTRRKIEDQMEHLDPRERMAFCKEDLRSCSNLHDLLDNFHQAFSEDQLWAIVFQYVTLYRNAIVQIGGRAASRASSTTTTGSELNDSGRSSTKTASPRRKSKSGEGSGSPGKKDVKRDALNESCSSGRASASWSESEGTSSDVDLGESDTSDIMHHLMVGDSIRDEGPREIAKSKQQLRRSTLDSSDEGECGDGNEKPKLRLDHVDYLFVPTSLRNFHIHKDGSVHVSYVDEEPSAMKANTQKQVLMKLGFIFYRTMDFHLQDNEECLMSPQMEELMCLLINEDDYDEGIEGDLDTKEMEHILQICHNRCKTYCPESHYKAVCRALVTEVGDLKLFLQKIKDGETEQMRLSVNAQAPKQELDQLYLNDWIAEALGSHATGQDIWS